MLVAEALAGLWVTSHNLESHHYLIDTIFIVLAVLIILVINITLLHATFRPLFRLQSTMRAISMGQTDMRTPVPSDSDIGELAQTFNEMLDQLEEARREQAMVILQAQEEERRRIARELHDETSQRLTALLIHTEVLTQRLAGVPESSISQQTRTQIEEGFAGLTKLTQGSLDTIRVLAQQLRPSVLDDLGLEAALRWLAEDSRERFHLSVECYIKMQETTSYRSHLPPVYETTIFRIAQESLTNAARYAHSEHVSLTLNYDRNDIILSVTDDGCGFDPTQVKAGLGIRGMRERAMLLGGTLRLDSLPDKGTMVHAIFPLPSKA
jgi:two-component system sensor histidine kinase UhpB